MRWSSCLPLRWPPGWWCCLPPSPPPAKSGRGNTPSCAPWAPAPACCARCSGPNWPVSACWPAFWPVPWRWRWAGRWRASCLISVGPPHPGCRWPAPARGPCWRWLRAGGADALRGSAEGGRGPERLTPLPNRSCQRRRSADSTNARQAAPAKCPDASGMESRRQQRAKARHVDIAAADQHAHALARKLAAQRVRRRKAQAAGGLDDELHALGKKAHGVDQLLVGHGQDVVEIGRDDGEGDLPQVLRLRAIGDRPGGVDVHDGAAAKRLLAVVAGSRLDAVELAPGRQRARGQGRA